MNNFKINKECRLCKNKLKIIINIGPQPLANKYLNLKQKKYPLNLCQCTKCGFLQLQEAFNSNFLFSKYNYYSPENNEVHNHHLFILNKINKIRKIKKNDKILEIGSNNCTFLDLIKFKYNCKTLGVDPAKNLKSIYKSKNINVFPFEFNYKNSKKIKIKRGTFNLIILRHVFAHIDNLESVTKGLSNLIKDDGLIYIENAYALNTLKKNEFDQIYHEHMSYISIKPLIPFFKKFNLSIFDAFETAIHGGSISIILDRFNRKISRNINKLISKEEKIYQGSLIKKFVTKTKKNKLIFKKFIHKIKNNNNVIGAYGASAKGNTLLNYYELTNKEINYSFDNTDIKINKYLPGSNIKIISSDSNLKYKCNYIIVTAWNFIKTIIKKEKIFLKQNGKFIIPNPLKIISINNYKKYI